MSKALKCCNKSLHFDIERRLSYFEQEKLYELWNRIIKNLDNLYVWGRKENQILWNHEVISMYQLQ